LEGGKLGLGNAWRKGCVLNFTKVPDLPPVVSVACGPMHMLAITEYSAENYEKDGTTYAWGKNSRG
jgi:alpha-tubulin suppressor-like RCC1 family protein